MAKLKFLTLEQILAIHHDQIERYGGSHGIRSMALLESAVFRPQSSFMGEDLHLGLFDKVSALIHSLLMNHPFLDGNKRTSLVSGGAFLHLNNFSLKCTPQEVVEIALKIESKEFRLKELSSWLKDHSVNTRK